MRRAVWSGVVVMGVLACSSQKEPPRPNAICPDVVQNEIWARELFPGCPPAPFADVGVVCDGACPRPCESTLQPERGEATTMRFEYADDGSWSRTLHGDSEERPEPRPGPRYCEGTGRHRECEVAVTDGRYAAGLDDDREVAKYTVDGAGNVIEVQPIYDHEPVKLTYDGRRLMTERRPHGLVRKYHYDALGRIDTIEANSGGRHAATFIYDDATHRLAQLVRKAPYEPDDVTSFEYDDRGRPILVTRTLSDRSTVRRYVYDCPAR